MQTIKEVKMYEYLWLILAGIGALLILLAIIAGKLFGSSTFAPICVTGGMLLLPAAVVYGATPGKTVLHIILFSAYIVIMIFVIYRMKKY